MIIVHHSFLYIIVLNLNCFVVANTALVVGPWSLEGHVEMTSISHY